MTNTIAKEIALLERAGLMPTGIGDAHLRAEQERRLQQVEKVLRLHGVPPAVYEDLAAVFDEEGDG